ncbi:hypothetical protein M3Y97_01017800 [Aphelenchoides bicaudatus]|nr:hypothetical protein M3Y97_01017800 [Aphelenchoides bicaudatus]
MASDETYSDGSDAVKIEITMHFLSNVLVTSRCLSTSSRLMLAKDDQDDKLKAELDELTKKLNEDLKQRPQETEQELDKNFMNFRRLREKAEHERSYIFGWKTVTATLGLIGCALAGLLYMRKIRLDEQTKQRKIMAGKARIGGEWELVNSEGKLEGSKDLLGNWVLMYFGFTNCPDICPDEIEKMVDVVDMLDKDKEPIPVVPVFITVDPIRDNAARVKKYCAEFSPKIRGYTGDKEQTEKVLKTFRIYHSQGPPAAGEEDDYIVDHTVMMYLIDPEGNFFDYYGQTRRAGEIANVIRTKVLSYQLNKKKGYFFS